MLMQNRSKMALPVTYKVGGVQRSMMLMPGQSLEVDEAVPPVPNGVKVTSSAKASKVKANTTPPAPPAPDAAKPAA